MPELPEVETVCRGLSPVLKGSSLKKVVVRNYNLRIDVPKNFCVITEGQVVRQVYRRAKYILIELIGGDVIICHLGMSGKIRIIFSGDLIPPPNVHDHIDIYTGKGDLIRYTDPRRFGLVTLGKIEQLETNRLLKKIGPEPLDDNFNASVLIAQLQNRRVSIKNALLDQKVLAGLGNIYVCEILFRSCISPKRLAMNIKGKRAKRLVNSIKEVLREACEAGGSSIKDHALPDGKLGYFQTAFRVYGKKGEACLGCDCDILQGGGIRRIIQGRRSTFYCPYKQK